MNSIATRSTPWHLWVVAVLTLLWNGVGAVTILNVYDVAAETSLTLVDQGWRTLTIVLVIIALLQFAYAWAMKKRRVLT